MSQMDPVAEIAGIIEGHIYAGIKIARRVPQVAAGQTAQRALAASLAASCLKALGIVPRRNSPEGLADILGITDGPGRQERLAEALGVIDCAPEEAGGLCLPENGGK